MKKLHFDQERKYSANKIINWDKGPQKGMGPKKDYSKFEIIFDVNGNFELVVAHEHKEDNIDHGERNYEQHSNFSGSYEIETDSNDSLIVKLNVYKEIKTIKECTNFDFIPREEKNHELTLIFSKNKNEFSFSESDIFIFERGYYGSFVFMQNNLKKNFKKNKKIRK